MRVITVRESIVATLPKFAPAAVHYQSVLPLLVVLLLFWTSFFLQPWRMHMPSSFSTTAVPWKVLQRTIQPLTTRHRQRTFHTSSKIWRSPAVPSSIVGHFLWRATAVSSFHPIATVSAAAAANPSSFYSKLFFSSSSSSSSTSSPSTTPSFPPTSTADDSSSSTSTSDTATPSSSSSSSFAVPAMGTDQTNGVGGSVSVSTESSNGSDAVPGATPYTDYERWVRRLYATNMFHPVKLGLDNMKQLHKLLGNPMDDPNRVVIHVAGTNGKGSVCLKIANALQQQKYKDLTRNLKVGLFCSPHIASFRERMQVNGEMITEEEVVEILPKIYDLCIEHDIPATFFEITTALAFAFYAKRGADVVVLETGLGGRLDATNVVTKPALTIITSIGLEHTRILGDTIELIAREKGGIIKPGCPVLVGPHCPHEVLQQCAKEKAGGPYYLPSLVFRRLDDATSSTGVGENEDEYADYDLENQDIAKAALELLKQSNPEIVDGLTSDQIHNGTSIRPPCRFQLVQRDDATVILDVAHNPPAMEYLVRKLELMYPDASFRFVAGMSSDKDLTKCSQALLSTVAQNATRIHLVEAAHPRAAKLEAILEAEPALQAAHYDLTNRSITKQVVEALETAKNQKEVLVVCGSVFLMAEAREALGFDEPRDSDFIAEMAGAGTRHGQENFGNTTTSSEKSATRP